MATYVRQQEIAHRTGLAGRFQLRLTDADVRIRPADGEEVRVRATFEIGAGSDDEADATFEAVKLIVSSGASYLDLRSRDDGEPGSLKQALGIPDGATLRRWITGSPRFELAVEVEAPPGTELRIETVSGDLVVHGMIGEQRYSSVSGDQYLTELGGSIRINTVSGDATLRAVAPLRVRAESVSGDVSVMAPRLDELRLTTVSGDLEVEGELGQRGDHRIESVSGDLLFGLIGSATIDVRGISTDIQAEMSHRLEGRMDRRRVVIGTGEPTIVFSSMSGDVVVRHPRRQERQTAQSTSKQPQPTLETATSADSLEILRALERGEIDVDEAARRLGEGGSDA
jgi:hypothetical protein